MPSPDVFDLLEYWQDYPPAHLLLRAMAHFEGTGEGSGRRKRKAEQMQDPVYKDRKESGTVATAMLSSAFAGSKHSDCAPPHLQQAMERAKNKQHLNTPSAGGLPLTSGQTETETVQKGNPLPA